MLFSNSAGAPPGLYSSFPSGGSGAGVLAPTMRRLDYSHDVPPLGCNHDAMKLFVGNIPKSYTADSLRPLFEAIGTVVELVVVRDKLTDESKGSAFVWYQTRGEAERAIAELHLRRVLQDPTGEQDRPLVVRRANPKVAPVLLSSAMLPHQPTFSAMGASDTDLPTHLQGAPFFQPTRSSFDSVGVHMGSHQQHQQHSSPQVNQMQMMQEQLNSLGLNSNIPLSAPGVSGGSAETEQLLGRFAAKTQGFNAFLDQNTHCSLLGQTAPPPVFPSLSNTKCSARHNDLSAILQSTLNASFQNNGTSAASPPAPAVNGGGAMGFGQMTLALHVGRPQVTVVATNLHSIQGNTGAMVQLTPGTGDSYVLLLSGNDSQLDAAKSLVHDLVAQPSSV